jgi:hypothetical protein
MYVAYFPAMEREAGCAACCNTVTSYYGDVTTLESPSIYLFLLPAYQSVFIPYKHRNKDMSRKYALLVTFWLD